MDTPAVRLPTIHAGVETYQLSGAQPYPSVATAPRSRLALAAVHVVADPLATTDPHTDTAIDWDATLAFRHHIWRLGFGVAEAMDTAQRGMGLPWSAARELVVRSSAEARAVGGRIGCGVGTDQLEPGAADVDAVVGAYLEQLEVVEGAGAQPIIMASRALAACATGPDDYRRVYEAILTQVGGPVILHWLGPSFDPALAGYWGTASVPDATALLLDLVGDHADRVEGIKVSLLDLAHEEDLRRRVPDGVRVFTGDDFNFAALIRGDGERHSDALLGIFDAATPAAAAALRALDDGDLDAYDAILRPVVTLSRHLFGAPTPYYKAGVVFLAWLNDHQRHFRMLDGLESSRSVLHLADAFRLADAAGLLNDPDLAAQRMRALMVVAGVS